MTTTRLRQHRRSITAANATTTSFPPSRAAQIRLRFHENEAVFPRASPYRLVPNILTVSTTEQVRLKVYIMRWRKVGGVSREIP